MFDINEFSGAVKAFFELINNFYTSYSEPKKARKMLDIEAEGIKKIAEANAYAVNTLCDSLRKNNIGNLTENLPPLLDNKFNKQNDMLSRATLKEINSSIRKEVNIETIFQKTYNELENKELKSDDKVDNDWITRFIDIAENISNDDLQTLWSKILANEIIEPKSYSLRTLDVLKNLSTHEAKLFEEASNYVINDSFLLSETDNILNYPITYYNLTVLSECGLIKDEPLLAYNKKLNNFPEKVLEYGNYLLLCDSSLEKEIQMEIYPLTSTGKELYEIINCEISKKFFIEIAKNLSEKEKKSSFSIHEILSKEQKGLRYKRTSIWTSLNSVE